MSATPLFAAAAWIMSPVVGGPATCAPAPYFRKSFRIDQPIQSATLVVTACGLYECEINGSRVGEAVFAPGWTDYHKRVPYQSYDVTRLLQTGENVLGAILGDGWYSGYVAWCGRQQYGDRPRFLAHLRVVHANGATDIVTDSSWKTAVGPILESDFLMGESYDARLELGEWTKAPYDDSDWKPVIVDANLKANLVPQVGPPVRRMETLKPVSIKVLDAWPKPERIYDFGQNFSGRVRITLKGNAGATLKLRFAEILNEKGQLYTENLRGARCIDYYTCKGGEQESWEPRFTFHGFRYLEITGLTADQEVEVTGIVLHSDTPPTGNFSCSHDLLNQLQRNIIWGQKSNFLEVPTDCPQRDERLGWTGDAQVFVRTAAFNMDVQAFFHKWMQDARDAQTDKGSVPYVIPNVLRESTDGGPAWADATIICPWTIYLCYGDKQILSDHYDSMRRYMTYMTEHQSIGLIRVHPDKKEWQGFGDWLALDGSGQTEGGTPKDLIGTAFLAHDAGLMAKIADVLGHSDDAKKYRVLRTEVTEAFRRRYVTPDGLIASGTQTSMVLALHFNLVPEEAQKVTARELVRDIEKRKFHLATGFVGTPYLLDVLTRFGYLDVAYKLLEQETFPSWLFPLKNGATTIWERWDGWTTTKGFQDKGMNSFNHYAYGAVGAWMYGTVAGLELDPDEPGYSHVVFKPRPGGSIKWAEADLQTKQGKAAIRWELVEAGLKVRLTVPESCHATFYPPEGFKAENTKLNSGVHEFTCARQ